MWSKNDKKWLAIMIAAAAWIMLAFILNVAGVTTRTQMNLMILPPTIAVIVIYFVYTNKNNKL